MSKSIVLAVVAAVVFVITSIIYAVLQLSYTDESPLWVVLSVAIALLVLVGIIKGQRLAWQWGMVFGLLGAIAASFRAYSIASDYPGLWQLTALYTSQAGALFMIFLILNTQGAKDHFRLRCPSCESRKVKAVNFLYSKAKCRKCDATWA